MEKCETVGTSNRIYTLLLACLISCFFIFESSSWSSLSVIGVTAALLLAYAIGKRGRLRLRLTAYHSRIGIFVVYSFMTALWSWSSSATISRSTTVLFNFLCMAVVYMIYGDGGSLEDYFRAIMLSGIIISLYTVSFVGLDNLKYATEAKGRIEGDEFYASINAMGMWMSVCTIVFVHRILNTKFKPWYLLGVFPVVMIAVAQSRTALIEAVLGVVLVFIFKTRNSKRVSKKLGNFVVGILVMVGVFYAVTQMDIFAGLYNRMRSIFGLSTVHKEGSMVLRSSMIEIGLDQFKKTPIFGIGVGASRVLTKTYLSLSTYLHNNFVEMLACGGMVGFLLYYSVHWYVLKNLWKAKAFRKPDLQLCMLLMIIHVLGDYGTVSFYKKPTYVIITLGYLAVAMARRGEGTHEE